jgi:hypothetical protein
VTGHRYQAGRSSLACGNEIRSVYPAREPCLDSGLARRAGDATRAGWCFTALGAGAGPANVLGPRASSLAETRTLIDVTLAKPAGSAAQLEQALGRSPLSVSR